MIGVHHRGHDDHIGDLAEFRRLDVKGQKRKTQPTAVAVDLQAIGGQQHDQQQRIEQHQPSAPLGYGFDIDGGHHRIGADTGKNGEDLHRHIPDIAQIIGGAGDHQATEGSGAYTQKQQHHIAPAKEIAKFGEKLTHRPSTPFLFGYCIIPKKKSK